MTAERLVKNFERMVITSERLKKFPNGRPERLNGRSKISNGWSWTAERLDKNFERMVITGERLKKISNGRPKRLNGTSKIILNGRPEQLNGIECRSFAADLPLDKLQKFYNNFIMAVSNWMGHERVSFFRHAEYKQTCSRQTWTKKERLNALMLLNKNLLWPSQNGKRE